jgi:DnaK suppressor protein
VRQSDLDEFRQWLLAEREAVIERAHRTWAQDATFDTSELPEKFDQASAECSDSMRFRLGNRAKHYREKTDQALRKVDAGELGLCKTW